MIGSFCKKVAGRRTFFFSAQSLAKTHREHKLIGGVSCEELFDVVVAVDHYQSFLPFCVQSKILKAANQNVMLAELEIGFRVFTEKYTSRILMRRPNKVVTKSIESPVFRRIESEWSLKPGPTPDSCEVDFKVDFEVTSRLHAHAISLFFDDVASSELSAFVKRAKQLKRQRMLLQQQQQQKNISASSSKAFSEILANKLSKQEISKLQMIYCEYSDCDINSDDISDRQMHFRQFKEACEHLWSSKSSSKLDDITSSSALLAAIFTSFDESLNMKDYLTFHEFCLSVYLMVRGTPEEKSEYIFCTIDLNGNNQIERQELAAAMERRIRVVTRVVQKLKREELRKSLNFSKQSSKNIEEILQGDMKIFNKVMQDIQQDIPLAVNRIFQQTDLDHSDSITLDEWQLAWRMQPELLEMMTIEGMVKMVEWAYAIEERPVSNELESQLKLED